MCVCRIPAISHAWYKCLQNLNSDFCSDFFVKLSDSGQRFSRRTSDEISLCVPKVTTNFLKTVFSSLALSSTISFQLKSGTLEISKNLKLNYRTFYSDFISFYYLFILNVFYTLVLNGNQSLTD